MEEKFEENIVKIKTAINTQWFRAVGFKVGGGLNV